MKKTTPFFFLAPVLIMIFAVILYPMIYSIYMSVHKFKLTGTAEIEFVGLNNFAELVVDPVFLNAAQLSLTFVVLATTFEILLGLGMATLLNIKVKGSGIVRIIITIPIVLTPVTVGIFWKMILHPEAGWLNQFLLLLGLPTQNLLGDPATALFGTVLVDVWEWTPFVCLILLASMQAIPKETLEAARTYGASSMQIFRYITLPLITRGIFIAGLLRAIDAARTFDQIYVLTKGGPALSTDYLSLFIYRVGLNYFNLGYASAASWLYLIVISTAFLIILKGLRIKI